MTHGAPSDVDLPAVLVGRGWRQGAIFPAPGLSICQMDVEDLGSSARSFVVRRFASQPNDRYVVTTQTCDIRAALADEPVIEALLCRVVLNQNWRANISKSARYFEIDRNKGLIAHAAFRVQVAKSALLHLSPEPWPDTSFRLERFTSWLGHRFSRPAIPDDVVAGFQRPADDVLQHFRRKRNGEFQAFQQAVSQIRIATPRGTAPPFTVHVVLLSFLGELSKEKSDAINEVMEAIEARVNPALVRLQPYRLLTPDTMSVAEYLATKPLYFDFYTYRGDEVIGAEPPAQH